jgi:hypothetical protein
MRWLLFAALLLVAPILVLTGGLLATVPVGAWLISAVGAWRQQRVETVSALVVGPQVLAWVGVWWVLAGEWSRAIRRAPPQVRVTLALVSTVLIAAAGALPIYGRAAAPGVAWITSAYDAYAETIRDACAR